MSTDITLDGVGYMVLPGSYRADSVIVSMTTPGTLGEGPELSAGQRRGRAVAADLGRNGAVAGGVGGLLPAVGPAWRMPFPIGWTGIGPPPLAGARSGTVSSATGRAGIGTKDFGFLTSGTTLYRWNATTISSRHTTMGAAAVGLAVRGDRDLFVAFGASQDVARWEDGSSTWTASAFGAGEKASLIAMLADRPVVVKPNEPDRIYVWTSTFSSAPSYTVNGEVLALAPTGQGIVIATTQSWYLLEDVDGAPFQVLPVAQPVSNASEAVLLVHRGTVLAVVDGELWQREGLSGRWEHIDAPGVVSQLTGFGGWLLAHLTNYYGTSGVWAWDGGAWFFIDGSVDQIHPGPHGLAGATIDNDNGFLAFDDRNPNDAGEYIENYSVATALSGEAIERDKSWSRIGAEFHRPDGEPVGSWSAQLQYSVDAGRSWTNAAGSQTVDAEHQRITADLSDVSARVLMVRVNLIATSGLAPALTALWADWSVTEGDGGGEGTPGTSAETARTLERRWRMTVLAQDGVIDRDGTALGLDATTIRSNLWARLNQTSSFTDVDGTIHSPVTLSAIEEEWPSPADAAQHVATRECRDWWEFVVRSL